MKSMVAFVILLLLLVVVAWVCYRQFGGMSHGELKMAVERESAVIQMRVDARYEALDARLDRMEAKLDKLIEMATPKLSDGMTPVE